MKKELLYSICLVSTLYAKDTEQFSLGQIDISDDLEQQNSVEIYSEEFELHSQEDISEALQSASGVFLSKLGGRNESTVSIRGFDSRRVSVYMDGIPISVPYDGNFDYSRFLTADLSKISISKGFSSVTYGANTMAGIINLVSKKPVKEIEGDISLGFSFDDDFDSNMYKTSFNVGTNQGAYYVQFSGSLKDRDHFNLSNDFEHTSLQDSDERVNSSSKDAKGSIKVGITPDENSEYAFVYSKQHGKKEQPMVTDSTYSKVKYWDWPYWDRESLYFLSNNQFKNSYLKTRLYKDIYENSLQSYDDTSYSTQTKKYAFDSRYDDYSVGGSVEYGMNFKTNEIKTSFTYKNDFHRAYDSGDLDEDYEDETISLGLEDIYSLTNDLSLVGGVSYDRLKPKKLWDTNSAPVTMGDTQDSWNPQIGLFYNIDGKQQTGFSVSRKTHLATMKERYSRKLGTAIANPDLEAEKAIHYELSYSNKLTSDLNFKTNIFVIDIKDAIQSIELSSGYDQNQNVGDFRHSGFELEANYYINNSELGANYTYINIHNKTGSVVKRLGIPKHSTFIYGKYNINEKFAYYASITAQTGQYSQNSGTYYETSGFATFDTKFIYNYDNLTLEAGIKNLFDKNYEYDKGFPEAGREFFANLKYSF